MPFTRKAIDFLFENRMRNSKSWYVEHKSDYQNYVFIPLAEFVEKLAPTLLEIDSLLICEPKVDKSISRIYRDTRFSKDKSLYRDVMWCSFMRLRKLTGGLPGFFFELSQTGFRYGCGYYMAATDTMDSMRKLIINGDKDFKKALKAFEHQTVFAMEGDSYKKSRHPQNPENIRNWLDRKTIGFIHTSTDFDLLFSNNLAEKIANDYKLIEPIYKFLLKCEDVK